MARLICSLVFTNMFIFINALPIPERLNQAVGRELYTSLVSANSTCFNKILGKLILSCSEDNGPDSLQVSATASDLLDCFSEISSPNPPPHCGADLSCIFAQKELVLKWADLASLVMPLCEHLKLMNKTYIEILQETLANGGIGIFPRALTQTFEWSMKQWFLRIVISQLYLCSPANY